MNRRKPSKPRKLCLHDSDPRQCAKCAFARFCLLLAAARLARATRVVSIYAGSTVTPEDGARLHRACDSYFFALGGYHCCLRRGSAKRGSR